MNLKGFFLKGEKVPFIDIKHGNSSDQRNE